MQLTRRAYAKVNLALSVGPLTPSTSGGPALHPISSWMHAVDLFDTVTLTWLGEHHPQRFETGWAADAPRQSKIDWPMESDLALRALRLMEQTFGRTLPVGIRIDKRIPVGGGLGGGSSDAAAVLVGLRDLLSLPQTNDQLARLSARLGSDIAYFIDDAPPAPAIVSGLGDRIARLPRSLAGRDIILIFPKFGCPTGPVYKAFDLLSAKPLRDVTPIAAADGEGLFNDLLPAAERVQPALATLRRSIEAALGIPIHMSGSGSTLFALPTGEPAESLAPKIALQTPDISVLTTRLI